jgi:hypothetical protein
MAAGGGNPPPFIPVIVNPAIQSTILVDLPPNSVTGAAGQPATIYLRQGTITAQAAFNIADSLLTRAWQRGCITDLTNARFLWAPPTFQNTLGDWVPPFVLESLFLPFGIVTSPSLIPVITQISGNQCLALQNQPNWLLMNGTIQFLVPPK